MVKAEYAIRAVKDAYAVLHTEDDLSPRNPRINDTLGRLVRVLSAPYTAEEERHILTDKDIRHMRPSMLEKLARAEGEMELFWSEKFCEGTSITQQHMEDFWYWRNYKDLVSGEVRHMPNRLFKPDESLCFVGSGPLPLTAVCMAQMTGKKVTCVDCDETACRAARLFLDKAGLSDTITVAHADGATYNFEKHPYVLVAALVPDKDSVLGRIAETQKNACVGLRSAERLHTLLYDPVDEVSGACAQCTPMARTPHDPQIINTTLFVMIPPEFTFEREKHIKGKTRPKYGWRNTDIPIFPPVG